MKCTVCHSDNVVTRKVEEEIRVGNDFVIVPIETQVCETCGERYYNRATLRHLEEIEKKLKEQKKLLRQVGKVLVYE
jgi:YgiT-type zinc finger domain-containing protein